jgi:acetyl esterase/lipase
MKKYVIIFLLLLTNFIAHAQDKVNIWAGCDGHVAVEMTSYIAAGNNNKAVVVCPGGSYFWHDMEAEGHCVGRWLKANGISAFVLRYRAAGVFAFVTHYRYIFRGRRYPDALDDLHQAMVHIKNHAKEYHINPDSIGAMGFSAGGHLVMSAAELLPRTKRPAFVAPIYPVVTLTEPCVHKRSRRALLGDSRKNNRKLRDSLSLERHVPADCPPVFLVNCQDDPIVKYHNSELLDSALTAQGVSHLYIQYKTGGHGFGATSDKGTAECRGWKDAFLKWVASLP